MYFRRAKLRVNLGGGGWWSATFHVWQVSFSYEPANGLSSAKNGCLQGKKAWVQFLLFQNVSNLLGFFRVTQKKE